MTPFTRSRAIDARRAALVLALAAPVPVSADPEISASGMHIPTLTNFCGQDAAIVEATLCNDGTEPISVSLDLFDGGTPPVYGCTESIIPDHQFLDPPSLSVAPGACETVRIQMARPSELDVHGNVCWWTRFDIAGGSTIGLGAQLIDFVPICFDWSFEEAVVFVHPLDPVVLDPRVVNTTDEVRVFEYLILARGPENAPDEVFISLNDQAPGMPVEGVVDIEPGGEAVIPLTAAWLEPDKGRYFDVVITGEGPSPGRHARGGPFVDLASIGLHEALETVGVGSPATPGARPLRPVPNPVPAGGFVSLGGSARVRAATIHDAAGRLVRVLDSGAGGGVTWDARLADGSLAAPGTYFVRLSGSTGTEVSRIVVLP